MKTKIFIFTVALISTIFMSSCGSSSEKKSEIVRKEISVIDTTMNWIERFDLNRVVGSWLSTEEEQLMLEKISNITDPVVAYKVYCRKYYGSKVEKAAYAKREELMLVKISNFDDPVDAYKIYEGETYSSKVEKAAYAKWEELMLVKISNFTDPIDAWKIVMSETAGSKVEKAAYGRYKELGGKMRL